MTEQTEMVKRTYISCDGCGYTISPKSETVGYMILTIRNPGCEDRDLHFHEPAAENENRSWGSRDCLGYYWNNKRARRDLK